MPTILLDKEKCLRNIKWMAQKAASNNLSFRPHCKTHQSAEIGNWFSDFGVSKITVSSFRMARYFANAGWKDILVAFPFNPNELGQLNELSKTARISILLDNPDTLTFLGKLEQDTPFYIDIDTGYGRTGIRSENKDEIESLLNVARLNKKLQFKGFYCHAGHSYKSSDPKVRRAIHDKSINDLSSLKKDFSQLEPLALYGDTPNCSTQENFTGINEITPGNFIFYDLTQVMLGSCSPDDVAVALACPITGKYPDRKQLVVHGGGVHFSKENLQIDGRTVFGQVVNPSGKGWTISGEKNFITSLSQEHGVLEQGSSLFERVHIGETLIFLPVHSCMTANLMREYQTLEGKRITTINT
jgi:D-serine deaminase-like pyridoxal phosphate-dependent protein